MAEKATGYRLEYSSSNRAKCKGPKPCAGSTISKGELRLGTLLEFRGNYSFGWRHWGCSTEKLFLNMKKQFTESSELDGYEELSVGDKKKVDIAWKTGHVAEEDIPATAKQPGDEEDNVEKPKKIAARSSKKLNDAEGEIEKPKRSRKKEVAEEGGEQEQKSKKTSRGQRAKKEVGLEKGDDDNQADEHEKPKTKSKKPSVKKMEASQDEQNEVDEDNKPKKRSTPRKSSGRRSEAMQGDNGELSETNNEASPKRTPGRKPRSKKIAAEQEDDDEESVAPKRGSTKKDPGPIGKSASKKRALKKNKADDEESGEDFTLAIEAVSADESASDNEDPEPKKTVDKVKVGRRKKASMKEAGETPLIKNGTENSAAEENGRKRKIPSSPRSSTNKPTSKRSKSALKNTSKKKNQETIEKEVEL